MPGQCLEVKAGRKAELKPKAVADIAGTRENGKDVFRRGLLT